jgi:signal peptidase I
MNSPSPKEAADSKSATPQNNEFRELIKTLILAFVFALVFRSFAYEPFHIPSGSMKSNLLIGDYIFISKFSYGYSRYSFPLGLIPFEGRIFASQPKRGDIVVFRPPRRPGDDFIKRLIGLPGDRIQMKDGLLYINDKPVEKEYVDDWTDEDLPAANAVFKRYRETLPEGKSYLTLYKPLPDPADNTKVFVVPEGHYFMMGDNRDNSQDSRFPNPVGFVPEENLVGRAELILFSWSCGYPFCLDRFLVRLP